MKNNLTPELYQNIDQRLQRLEGQVRGVRRMLEEDRDCSEVLTQLSAIRGAAHQIALRLMENYALECVNRKVNQEAPDETIAKMVQMLGKLS